MTKQSLKILKRLNRKGQLGYKDFSSIIDCSMHPYKNNYINELIDGGYIASLNDGAVFYQQIPPDQAAYKITIKGQDFLESKAKDRFRFALPIVISNLIALAALIIAILK